MLRAWSCAFLRTYLWRSFALHFGLALGMTCDIALYITRLLGVMLPKGEGLTVVLFFLAGRSFLTSSLDPTGCAAVARALSPTACSRACVCVS